MQVAGVLSQTPARHRAQILVLVKSGLSLSSTLECAKVQRWPRVQRPSSQKRQVFVLKHWIFWKLTVGDSDPFVGDNDPLFGDRDPFLSPPNRLNSPSSPKVSKFPNLSNSLSSSCVGGSPCASPRGSPRGSRRGNEVPRRSQPSFERASSTLARSLGERPPALGEPLECERGSDRDEGVDGDRERRL